MADSSAIKAGAAYVELFLKDGLTKGLKAASSRLKAWGGAMQSIGTRIAAVGGLVTAPILAAVQSVAEMGGSLSKMATRTGFSVEALSSLAFVAERSGADLETLEIGLRGMAKTFMKVDEGSKKAVKTLAKYGLTAAALEAMSPEQQFFALVDVLSQIEHPTERAGLAMQFFGRAGYKLLPMLARGRAGIAALQQEAGTLGRTMSTEDAQAAAKLAGTWGRLKSILIGLKNLVGAALLPTFLQAAETLKEWGLRVVGFIKNHREMVVTLFKAAVAVTVIGTVLAAVGTAIVGVGVVFGGMAAIASTVGAAFGVIANAIGAVLTPIGLVTAAVVGLAGYFAWSSGAIGQAVGWLKQQFTDLAGWVGVVWGGIRDALAAGDLALAGQVAMAGLRVAWETGLAGIRKAWTVGVNALLETWYGLKYNLEETTASTFATVLEIATEAWGGLQVGWGLVVTGMKTAWQMFTSSIREGLATVETAAKKMQVYLEWAQKPWSGEFRQQDLGDIDKQAAADKAARKQADEQARYAIVNESGARLRGVVGDTQAKLDAIRAKQRYDRRMRENLLGGEMSALGESTSGSLAAAERDLAAAKQGLADSVAAARSKAAAAAGDNTRGALPGLPEMPAPGDLQAAVAGAGAKGSIEGSFSALALAGMGRGNAADRTAKATEESAGHLRKLVKGQKAGRFVFSGDAAPA